MLPTAPGLTPLGFGIGGPRFFLRVAVTMILNCSVELAVIIYIIEDGGKHEVRMARTNLGLLFTHLVKKAWKNLSVKSKIVRKSSLKLTFILDDCRKADFARPNSEPYCLEYLPS